MRYSCVERAGPTLSIRRRSLCASGFLCMHKTVRGARRMNVHARRTPAMHRARWTNAGHTRGTRGAHAGHALCVRRVRPSARIARRGCTPSVLLTTVQRARRSSGVFLACAWRAHRVWPGVLQMRPSLPLITSPSTLMGDDIASFLPIVSRRTTSEDG